MEAYEVKQLEQPEHLNWKLGRIRCLFGLGEWKRLLTLAQSIWNTTHRHADARMQFAPLAAHAACALCVGVLDTVATTGAAAAGSLDSA